jgi:hypothetical protein
MRGDSRQIGETLNGEDGRKYRVKNRRQLNPVRIHRLSLHQSSTRHRILAVLRPEFSVSGDGAPRHRNRYGVVRRRTRRQRRRIACCRTLRRADHGIQRRTVFRAGPLRRSSVALAAARPVAAVADSVPDAAGNRDAAPLQRRCSAVAASFSRLVSTSAERSSGASQIIAVDRLPAASTTLAPTSTSSECRSDLASMRTERHFDA